MSTSILIFITAMGALFFASAVAALWWASRSGQFKKLEEGAKVIFDADEPIGVQTDFFPVSKKLKKLKKA